MGKTVKCVKALRPRGRPQNRKVQGLRNLAPMYMAGGWIIFLSAPGYATSSGGHAIDPMNVVIDAGAIVSLFVLLTLPRRIYKWVRARVEKRFASEREALVTELAEEKHKSAAERETLLVELTQARKESVSDCQARVKAEGTQDQMQEQLQNMAERVSSLELQLQILYTHSRGT